MKNHRKFTETENMYGQDCMQSQKMWHFESADRRENLNKERLELVGYGNGVLS